jgi:hypothetical protein
VDLVAGAGRGRRLKEPGDSSTWILLIFCRTAAPRHTRAERRTRTHNGRRTRGVGWEEWDEGNSGSLFSLALGCDSFIQLASLRRFVLCAAFFPYPDRDSGASSSLFSHSSRPSSFAPRRETKIMPARQGAARENGRVRGREGDRQREREPRAPRESGCVPTIYISGVLNFHRPFIHS